MPYTPTNWVDSTTPLSAANMNNLETQYSEAMSDIAAQTQSAPTPNTLVKRDANASFQIGQPLGASNSNELLGAFFSITTAPPVPGNLGPLLSWQHMNTLSVGIDASEGNPVPQITNFNPGQTTNFMGVISGYITVPTTGAYTFEVDSDDGATMWVNGALLVNNWQLEGVQAQGTGPKGTVSLNASVPYPVVITWFQGVGGGGLEVWVTSAPSGVTTPEIIPASWLSWDSGSIGNGFQFMWGTQPVPLFHTGAVSFASSGTFTVPDGVSRVFVQVWGGGGGGSSNGGGGGGGYAEGWVEVSSGQQISVTVAPGGSAGYSGGNSAFGSYISANGGSVGASGAPGYGGTGTLGINLYTGSPGSGINGGNGATSFGGAGAASENANGTVPGGGGAYTSGSGAPGIVHVYY